MPPDSPARHLGPTIDVNSLRLGADQLHHLHSYQQRAHRAESMNTTDVLLEGRIAIMLQWWRRHVRVSSKEKY